MDAGEPVQPVLVDWYPAHPYQFFVGFFSWLKKAMRWAEPWACDWVQSEDFDAWVRAWRGLDLEPGPLRVMLIAEWDTKELEKDEDE